ncbi:uncharacterized protein K02A2.6-like [Teleopsis dalmanni]|uniref:uncharacterized protein K02A2.6-like n=1 Tax=Teleopsis dalmanni TaxID=139649 RepID=UPI0018CEB4F4|nr:uncharacterized protein K02A2.6-like [Teleopsis dalmanni]
MCSNMVLIPFDPTLPIIVATDASPTGIAGVLSHNINGSERPIAFASRSVTKSESNYSQIDREALAIVFTVDHFFIIFRNDAKLPSITQSRLLRYAEFLQGFDYEIIFKKGIENSNVDCLSRATANNSRKSTDKSINEDVSQICYTTIFEISNEQLDSKILAFETGKDEKLSKLKTDILKSNNIQEFYVNDGIIFKGSRAVIPNSLQSIILKELHRTHCGIKKMKQLARRYCYWVGIDKDIEQTVRSCEECVKIQAMPHKVHVHHWESPQTNWERIHLDYAGPFQGYYFLVVIDAKSKWAEVSMLKQSPNSESSIKRLDRIFSSHGFPHVLVSDNATLFTSDTFKKY